MKLVHELHEDQGRRSHRLVDHDKPIECVRQPWVGYRTPAVYLPRRKGAAKYVAVTRHFAGSEEFPEPELIYWVTGLDKYAINDLPLCQAAIIVWDLMEDFLDQGDLNKEKVSGVLEQFVLSLATKVVELREKSQ